MTQIAVVQKAPAFLDKKKTIQSAVAVVQEAAANGARLVVFTEAFIPGYPAWIWRVKPGGDWNLSEALHQRLSTQSVTIGSDDLTPLYQVASDCQVSIMCGVVERDNLLSQSTLYNTALLIGSDGALLNRHRKLMPTNPERMVWGFGDGSGVKVVDTPAGRVGGLLCWENFMPLARYALYAQGVEIYLAPTYDSGDGWLGSLQHIAREGGCWVVGCGHLLRGSDIPDDFPARGELYPDKDEWINPGDSVVIAPGGEIVAGPLREQEGILYCDIELEKARIAKRTLDVAGHYARPDIFRLHVNSQTQSPVEFERD